VLRCEDDVGDTSAIFNGLIVEIRGGRESIDFRAIDVSRSFDLLLIPREFVLVASFAELRPEDSSG
jgi:hypothetical protein